MGFLFAKHMSTRKRSNPSLADSTQQHLWAALMRLSRVFQRPNYHASTAQIERNRQGIWGLAGALSVFELL